MPGVGDLMFDKPELELFYGLKENQLFRINEPNPGIFIAESPYVIERALEAGYEPVSFLVEEEQLKDSTKALLESQKVPVHICKYEELKDLVGYHMSRGLLCAMKRKPNPDLEELLKGKRRIVVLENIMNPTNVGAIIRSAAALGVEALVLSKGCADPLQRRASRVSMGNVFNLPWGYMKTNLVDMEFLKESGFKRISMALTVDSVFLDKISLKKDEKVAVIMGTEGEGLSSETLLNSDLVVKIPMSNNVDSLNVAAASAVAFWELCRP